MNTKKKKKIRRLIIKTIVVDPLEIVDWLDRPSILTVEQKHDLLTHHKCVLERTNGSITSYELVV
jgi:hypothetical protein